MKNLRNLTIGLLLGVTVVFTGCGDTTYTKDQLNVDMSTKTVYEKDGKVLANGTFNYNKSDSEKGTLILKDGLVLSVNATKGEEKIQANFKDKKLLLLDIGKNGKTEFFDNGELKYILYVDANTKAEAKFNKDEELPTYILNEIKPSNNKVLYENDILTISKLDTNKILESYTKNDTKTKILLDQVGSMMKYIAQSSHSKMYDEALNEISR